MKKKSCPDVNAPIARKIRLERPRKTRKPATAFFRCRSSSFPNAPARPAFAAILIWQHVITEQAALWMPPGGQTVRIAGDRTQATSLPLRGRLTPPGYRLAPW
jgi:hypothetical protein